MARQDIRWQQRFQNYGKALSQLTRFMERKELNDLEEQGLIQSFEYNHELAWKVLKDFLEFKNIEGQLFGSKDVSREAFKQGLLGDKEEDGIIWMNMINARNLTSHTYNEETTRLIVDAIIDDYYDAFVKLQLKLSRYIEN